MKRNTLKYKWKFRVFNADAQDVGRELEKIARSNKGELTAERVISAARPKQALLHDAFEWDDKKAADAHRIVQARYLIRQVAVVYESDGIEDRLIRGFVRIADDEGGYSYATLATAMSDKDKRKQVVERAWNELQAWRDRYADYEELAAVFSAIDQDRAA